MAKRKRASLKDKSPESLGLTPKKGKGIDLLFGGSSGTSSQTGPGTSGESDVTSEDVSTSTSDTSIVAPEEREVDELGLPVALEAPPDDLILASEAGEEDAVDPSISPFAMPTSGSSDTDSDLTGIVGQDNSPTLEDGTLSDTLDVNDLSGIVEDDTSSDVSGTEEDLSGLADDLSGLVVEDTPAAESSATVPTGPSTGSETGVSGAPQTGGPPAPQPAPSSPPVSSPPPTTAAPINVSPSPSVSQPATPFPATSPQPVPTYTEPASTYTPPVSNIPPPSTASGAPSMAAPRPVEFEGLSNEVAGTLGAFGSVLPDTREAFLPQDELPDEALIVTDREKVERDEALTQKVLSYIGSDRRDGLFEEIHKLMERVSSELHASPKDVSFALEVLREAANIIIEDPRQYDEALYRTAIVKSMLRRKAQLSFWSYRLGFVVLAYGIVFTAACALGYFADINFVALLGDEELGRIFKAVWFSGLAGGLGGSVEIFWRLYYRVSVKQDFDPQYTMYYLVKPILGFVLGCVMYFLVAVGSTIGGNTTLPQVEGTTGFVLAILLGFIAGYRQESVFDMIYVIVKKIAPEPGSTNPKSMIPVDDLNEVMDYNASSS